MNSSGFTAVPTAPPSDSLNPPPPYAPPPTYNQAVFQTDKTVYQPLGGVYQPPPMQQASNVQPITVSRLPDEHQNVQPITVSRLPDEHQEVQPITVSRLPDEHQEVANNQMTPTKIFTYFAFIMVIVFLIHFLPQIIYNNRSSSYEDDDDFYDELG